MTQFTQAFTDDQAVLNRVWSSTLLEELTRHGVHDVCVAPGSRSTPLVLEAQLHPHLHLHHHFDERGLGFYALGLAKVRQHPVAIIVTSGTAVANLLPAVAEANLTGEKLILLTSDRPQQLVDCGANQAIHQPGIFSSHVSAELNLPSPTTHIALNWLLTSIDQVILQQKDQGGAIHINCPYPEPLYSSQDKSLYAHYCQSIQAWQQHNKPYVDIVRYGHTMEMCAQQHAQELHTKKGVMIVGSVDKAQALCAVELAQQLGWPCLCDPQSGVSSAWPYYDVWLQDNNAQQVMASAEHIIQVGERIVSKRLNHWLKTHVSQQPLCQYWVISAARHRINQDHLPLRHIQHDGRAWLTSVLSALKAANAQSVSAQEHGKGWAMALRAHIERYQRQISDSAQQAFNELTIAVDITERGKQRDVFIGNSLIVRLLDMLSVMPDSETFSNRGASGIDGLVATAAGVKAGRNQPLFMLIGDTSLLYDLNSLALFDRQRMTENTPPTVIVVMNNDGGAIFDLLPVPAQQKQALYQVPHGYQFQYAAQQFNLAYAQPTTWSDYQQVIETHFSQGRGTLLVEVVTPPEQASTQLSALMQQLQSGE